MLLYHPAFDTYHSAFRLLLLMWRLDAQETPFARLRILDFYLLFPAEMEHMRFPQNMLKEKGPLKKLKSRYNRIPDPRRVFDELASFQSSGLQILLSTKLAIRNSSSDEIQILRNTIPQTLIATLDAAYNQRRPVLDLLTGPLRSIELYGDTGLKARTGLFEYRYDPV
jgi:hypothetical protein